MLSRGGRSRGSSPWLHGVVAIAGLGGRRPGLAAAAGRLGRRGLSESAKNSKLTEFP
ncbi:hypothetical protein PF008_g17566 [Phytophthora fragariae]|uniref:Uncharacterized protein n=1 Tax=Phytophthora fragariae TaxID=53985 RepID=A0A6G0R7Y0_9STRA|nr:hypothetical protein PF008_g17566 [Phytophthora fragariae]